MEELIRDYTRGYKREINIHIPNQIYRTVHRRLRTREGKKTYRFYFTKRQLTLKGTDIDTYPLN